MIRPCRASPAGPSFSVRSVVPALLVSALLGAACSPLPAVSLDRDEDGGALDAAKGDADVVADSAVTDGGPPSDGAAADTGSDAGLVCGPLGGTYTDAHKTCATASDCGMIGRGCYCGSQPILGISKAFLAAADACELKVAKSCALGCPNAPGRVAEDGRNDIDGGTIKVLCDLGKCHTVLP